MDTKPFFEKVDVFLPGDNFGVRLAGLIVTKKDTVIATCQKRKTSMQDFGHDIDILVQRSLDGGRTWGKQSVLFQEEGSCPYLGPVFQDRDSGTIFVTYFKMPSSEPADLEYFGTYAKESGGFWLIKSTDDGESWFLFAKGTYTVHVGEGGKPKTLKGVRSVGKNSQAVLKVEL